MEFPVGSLELPRAALRRGEAKVRGFQGLVLGCWKSWFSPGCCCCCCCCCCWCWWWWWFDDTFITTKLTSQPSPSQLKVLIIMRLLRWSYSIPNAVTWTVIGACKIICTNGRADGIREKRQASFGKAEACDDITLDTQHLFPVIFCLVSWSLLCFTNLISYQHKIRPTHLFDSCLMFAAEGFLVTMGHRSLPYQRSTQWVAPWGYFQLGIILLMGKFRTYDMLNIFRFINDLQGLKLFQVMFDFLHHPEKHRKTWVSIVFPLAGRFDRPFLQNCFCVPQ